MKLIVAGSRYYNNYSFVSDKIESFIMGFGYPLEDVEIVSGHCEGVDLLGERYAKENNLKLTIFEADWNKYNKAAGPIRNSLMASYATHCIVFYYENSKGSKDMISKAKNIELQSILL